MPTPPIFATVDPAADIDATIATYEALAGVTLQPTAVEHLILKAIAGRATLNAAAIQDAALQNLVEFSSAPALDYLGEIVGVTRLATGPASADMQFTLGGGHGGVTIPAGTRIATQDGQVIFQTTEDINVTAGVTSATGTAEASTDGIVGNDYAIGYVSVILDPVAFLLSAANTTTSTGGSDTETDAALRVRIKAAPSAFSTAGSRAAYRFHALTASALLSDVAVESSTPGQVEIYPLMADGSVTPSGILTAVEDATSAETVRPLSDTVSVIAPTAVAYTITANLTVYTGAVFADVDAAVTAALTQWVATQRQRLGIDIIDTQIHAVIHNAAPGLIYDIALSGWTDVVVSPTQFAKITGTPTVNITGSTNG